VREGGSWQAAGGQKIARRNWGEVDDLLGEGVIDRCRCVGPSALALALQPNRRPKADLWVAMPFYKERRGIRGASLCRIVVRIVGAPVAMRRLLEFAEFVLTARPGPLARGICRYVCMSGVNNVDLD
jgi:hypothetical protein